MNTAIAGLYIAAILHLQFWTFPEFQAAIHGYNGQVIGFRASNPTQYRR